MRKFGVILASTVVMALLAGSANELSTKLGLRWRAQESEILIPAESASASVVNEQAGTLRQLER